MKKITLLLILFIIVVSCKNDSKETVEPVVKPERIIYDFGFKLNDFTVIQDTIKNGDTFGSIIEKQNLDGKQIYDIIAKVKDSFNVRNVRIGKPFTMLLEKTKLKKLQYFIYQPDQLIPIMLIIQSKIITRNNQNYINS